MQGEGQEFESPRLHHPSPGSLIGRPSTCTRQHPNRIEETRVKTRDDPRVPGAVVDDGSKAGPRAVVPCHRVNPDPLIRALPARSPTSGSLERRTAQAVGGSSVATDGAHLNNWIRVSAVNRDLRFRRVSRRIPRPRSDRPLGQMLEGSSYKGHGVDALAPRADEGRGRLRKASGSREQTLIRRCPNGETRPG